MTKIHGRPQMIMSELQRPTGNANQKFVIHTNTTSNGSSTWNGDELAKHMVVQDSSEVFKHPKA
jgi:hypothetical protein